VSAILTERVGEMLTMVDSTTGKLMEKVGSLMNNEGLKEKGRERRESRGFGKEEEEEN
jgi:hypothetical protein